MFNIVSFYHFFNEIIFSDTEKNKGGLLNGKIYHEGFKKIQQKLNCYSFPSTSNQSNRNNDYRSYYNTESINIIADFYKDDIKQYNYKF